METEARVVIIGAGVAGCAVAEHLGELGWTDLLVIDQGPLFQTGGSTSHAPGVVFQTTPSKSMTGLATPRSAISMSCSLKASPASSRSAASRWPAPLSGFIG